MVLLLSLQLYYTPDTLHTYLALDYEEKIDAVRNDGMKADNVVKTLSEFVPQGVEEGGGRGEEGEERRVGEERGRGISV